MAIVVVVLGTKVKLSIFLRVWIEK